jgi:SOS response regulatory protein OraA/RecX
MLQALRISDACIGEALARIDPEEYERILVRVLDGKRRTMDECESYDARIKIIRFALQRGFEISEITKFVDET